MKLAQFSHWAHQGFRRWTGPISILVILSGIASCGQAASPSLKLPFPSSGSVTPIRALQSRPPSDATVYLQGRVGQQVPLLNQHVYQLQDATGTVWVLTEQAPLPPGQEVRIKGQVYYEPIPLGGRDWGEVYVREQEQLNSGAVEAVDETPTTTPSDQTNETDQGNERDAG